MIRRTCFVLKGLDDMKEILSRDKLNNVSPMKGVALKNTVRGPKLDTMLHNCRVRLCLDQTCRVTSRIALQTVVCEWKNLDKRVHDCQRRQVQYESETGETMRNRPT